MPGLLPHRLTVILQSIFWPYITYNGIVTNPNDFIIPQPSIPCELIPITPDNCGRVAEFREASRIAEYQHKLAKGEIGYYAIFDGKILASMWATVNRGRRPIVAKRYMRLMPGDAVAHDGVTSATARGNGVAPFMVGSIVHKLLTDHGARRIFLDVNVRNFPARRMLEKTGVDLKEKVLYVSALGTLLFQCRLKTYPTTSHKDSLEAHWNI